MLVLAHPDDESFICGGTLAKYASLGAEILLVCAAKGEMGRRVGIPPIVSRETLSTLRDRELQTACRYIGIRTLRYLGLIDKTVEFADKDKLTETIVGLMNGYKPDVVLTFHEKYGGHPDHCAIGAACTAAYRQYRAMQLANDEGLAYLYFINFGDGLKNPGKFGLRPDQVTRIDISAHLREKLMSFRAHRTQSEIMGWVWQPDEDAVASFGQYEYFMHGDGESRKNRHDLFADPV